MLFRPDDLIFIVGGEGRRGGPQDVMLHSPLWPLGLASVSIMRYLRYLVVYGVLFTK